MTKAERFEQLREFAAEAERTVYDERGIAIETHRADVRFLLEEIEVRDKIISGQINASAKTRSYRETANYIIGVVERAFGCARGTVRTPGRFQSQALARHLAMYFCRVRLRLSFPELGRVFELDDGHGNKRQMDHTSVMSGVKRIERKLLVDVNFADFVRKLETELDIEASARRLEEPAKFEESAQP